MMKSLAGFLIGAATIFTLAVLVEAAEPKKSYPDGRTPAGSRSALRPVKAPAFPQSTTIYLVPGARNTSAAGSGPATAVSCTNVSGVQVTVRFLVLQFDGTVSADKSIAIPHGGTSVATTKETVVYNEDLILNSGVLNNGAINVESTAAAVFCTAHVLDAASASPLGFDLHIVRVNAAPGTQE